MTQNQNIEAITALSPTQAGILYHSVASSDNALYFEQIVYEITGLVDAEAMHKAWERAVNRHSALRGLFTFEGRKEPLSVVRKTVGLPFTHSTGSGQASSVTDSGLDDFLEADRQKGFSLGVAPLCRLTLLSHTETMHSLIFSFHHIVMDGWSSVVLQREAFVLYDGLVSGKTANLGDATPYKRFLNWQKAQSLEKAKNYWQERLAGFEEPVMLADLVGARQQASGFEKIRGTISAAPLSTTAKQHKVTVNTLIQAAWAYLLSRYSDQTDIVHGVTFSGRPATLTGVEKMVGLFINTLPLRTQIDQEMQVGDFLSAVQTNLALISDVEYSSLIDIPAWTGIPRDFFDSIIVFENVPVDKGGIQSESLDIRVSRYEDRSNYPLSIIVMPAGDELELIFSYDKSKFSASQIKRTLSHLQTILAEFIEKPLAQLSELTILPDAENALVTQAWIGKRVPPHPAQTIHEIIESQPPSAIALIHNNKKLTYADLNQQANHLSNKLTQLGIQPNDRIGILLPRSFDMIIALLAVLKAGATYVPLDPDYPEDRLTFIAQDAGLKLVIGNSETADDGRQTIKLSDTLHAHTLSSLSTNHFPFDKAQGKPLNTNLAYIIYTSGSTGRPKGVAISHQNLIHATMMRQHVYETTPTSFLLLSSFSFDSSVVGIYSTLCTGGTLVLPESGQEQDLPALLTLIDTHQVSDLLCLPSLYQFLLDEGGAKLGSLHTVIVAGEACPPALLDQHNQILPTARLFNEYGPTEGTVWCTAHQLKPTDPSPLPIGRPMPNSQLRVVDQNLRPQPINVPGELIIGGDGVAQGYLNRPELTQEKFTDLGYRTGDKVRWLESGEVQYLGRTDTQLKIRGHRIEPTEIEAVILACDGVRETAVQAHDGKLVAYITGETDGSLIKTHLRSVLPSYMIPTWMIALDTLPRTPNGKIDHRALPIPTNQSTNQLTSQPTTPTQHHLLKIWQETLALDTISITDDFFDLGGHSLLALKLFGKLRKEMDVQLPLASLLNATTIQTMGQLIDQGATQDSLIVPIQPHGDRTPLFCIHGLTGDILWFRELGRRFTNRPIYGIQAIGLENDAEPLNSIPAMATRYIQAMRQIQPTGPYQIGGASFGGTLSWEIAHQLLAQGETVSQIILFDHLPRDWEAYTEGKSSDVGAFLTNAPRWFTEFRQLGSDKVLDRIQRKSKVALKQIGTPSQSETDSGDLIDYADSLPPHRQAIIAKNYEAILAYKPQPLPNIPTTLLRARAQPLFSPLGPEGNWDDTLSPNLVTIEVPGSHEGMFKSPHVDILAQTILKILRK